MRLHVTVEDPRTAKRRKIQRTARIVVGAALVLVFSAGSVVGQGLPRLGYPRDVPLEQAADVIVVLKPHGRHSLHVPAIVDRVVHGDIVRLEKGGLPTMIVHTRNTITSPLEADVPVTLYLKEFRDGRGHYIIGVDHASEGGRL